MIVVAIIGILAIIALPEYKEYQARAKISEAILATSPCRTMMTEAIALGVKSKATEGWRWNQVCDQGKQTEYSFDFSTGSHTLIKEAIYPSKYIEKIHIHSDTGSIEIRLKNIPELHYDQYNTQASIILTPYTIVNGKKRKLYQGEGITQPADPAPYPIHGWICNTSPNWYSVNIKYLPGECLLTRYNFLHYQDWNDLNAGKLGRALSK